MSAQQLSPQYVPRLEEQRRIIAQVAEVRASGQSRAILLYGHGGIGKTRLVRRLPEMDQDPKVTWLSPVDVDDSQHWLLSNLERHFADQLDPGHQYFGPYYEYVSQLPRRGNAPTSRENVLDYLNGIKVAFTQCYKSYIDGTGKTVVITFDTVEAIRGMHVLHTLTRWMKALPRTLFILAGRTQPGIGDWWDPIRIALQDPPAAMAVTSIQLGEFEAEDCKSYLLPISKEANLSANEQDKLVYLTQGHPLWLAFTVDYLANVGMPEEALAPLTAIKADLPYHGEAGISGNERSESFKRRLVAPYREADFWHEATKRLAVIRESVSQPIWQQLMAKVPLPDDVRDFDQAWERLTATQWIRPRANERYVTLHDAVAEELTQRVIKLHDIDRRWRRDLWREAAGIYAAQAAEQEGRLAPKQSDVDRRLHDAGITPEYATGRPAPEAEAGIMHDVAEADRWQQELHQLKAAHLFYLLLSDFRAGAQAFMALFKQARDEHDVLFEDLLAFQLQRFLPGGADQSTLSDAVGEEIRSFRDWLSADGMDSYLDVSLEMAQYLIDREQPAAADKILGALPIPADYERRYRYLSLRGNACMRIPGRVREGGKYFQDARTAADLIASPDQYHYISDAYKELGFFYRNIGLWTQADEAYENARNAILQAIEPANSLADREEMASIHTNWAYVKGVGGKYDDAINLVESAITVRRKIGKRYEQAISCSVKGEVYRYSRQFKEAWDSYAEAEQLFGKMNWSWLGVIYQEQAICLFQSIPAGVQLLASPEDPVEKAKSLILEALDLCRLFNVRYYPSALNRAGRIFGPREPDRGLSYLEEGADAAQELSDGWFLLANLIEYAELCYRAWADGGNPEYLARIAAISGRLERDQATELEFNELRGRWRILQGHLAMHEVLAGKNDMYDVALEHYRIGFPMIIHGWVGSYGASAIPGEFRKFRDLALRLPPEIRAQWQREMYRSWSAEEVSATQLLARLEELY